MTEPLPGSIFLFHLDLSFAAALKAEEDKNSNKPL
jgi:hypothetical protein